MLLMMIQKKNLIAKMRNIKTHPDPAPSPIDKANT